MSGRIVTYYQFVSCYNGYYGQIQMFSNTTNTNIHEVLNLD